MKNIYIFLHLIAAVAASINRANVSGSDSLYLKQSHSSNMMNDVNRHFKRRPQLRRSHIPANLLCLAVEPAPTAQAATQAAAAAWIEQLEALPERALCAPP